MPDFRGVEDPEAWLLDNAQVGAGETMGFAFWTFWVTHTATAMGLLFQGYLETFNALDLKLAGVRTSSCEESGWEGAAYPSIPGEQEPSVGVLRPLVGSRAPFDS